MIQFVCYFFPAFLAMHFDKDNKDYKDFGHFIIQFGMYVIFINIAVFVVLFLFTPYRYYYFTMAHFNTSFSLQYLILSSVLAWLIPIGISFIKKHLELSVEVTKK